MAIRVGVNILLFCLVCNSLSHANLTIKWEVYFFKKSSLVFIIVSICILHVYVYSFSIWQYNKKKHCVFPWYCRATFSKNHAGKIIAFRLVCSTPSTIFNRPCTKWFQSFLFSINCFEWQKIFSTRSGEKVYGKLLEWETRWILLTGNQYTTW